MAVKGMAIPLLVGTGVQILGAKQGWDPRITALASMAAGGIGAGMASGAFSGGVAGTAAMSPGAATNAFNPATTGVLAGSQAGQTALASRMAAAGGISTASSLNPMVSAGGTGVNLTTPYNPTPYYNPNPMESPAVAEIKAPFFDRTQYEWNTEKVTNADGTTSLKRTKMPVLDDAGNPVKGLSAADSLGINLADTFLKYELAEAQKPPPRPVRSGGGGGGSGGPMAPAYNGGGGSGQKQVTWGFGGGNNNGYQPQGLV
jgi:hypothetical protein